MNSEARTAWEFIQNQVDKVFPAEFDFVITSKGNDKISKKTLFGGGQQVYRQEPISFEEK